MSRSRDLSKGTTRTEYVFTATSSQTTFATDDTSTALAYSPGKIDVYKQGLKLKAADYTATNGTSVVLGSGATASDTLNIKAYAVATVTSLSAAEITSGTLAVARGGTGISSYTAGDIIYASGTTTITKLAKGTGGQALVMNSGATAPEWVGPGKNIALAMIFG